MQFVILICNVFFNDRIKLFVVVCADNDWGVSQGFSFLFSGVETR